MGMRAGRKAAASMVGAGRSDAASFFAGMPTRSRHAHGAVARGDNFRMAEVGR